MRNKIYNSKSFIAKARSIVMVIMLCLTGHLVYSIDIQVYPSEIHFNCEPGNTNDGLDICDSNGVPIEQAEWDDSYTPNKNRYSIAYLRSQFNHKIKVRFNSNYGGKMNVLINLTCPPGTGLGNICNLFIPNLSFDSLYTFNLTSTIPISISKNTFSWKWNIYAIPTSVSNYCAAHDTTTTTHTFYTLLDIPKAPMAKPWESVLDLACKWAQSQTDTIIIVSKITENAYNNDFSIKKTYLNSVTHTTLTTFHLKTFLNAGYVDCQDMSAVVQVFSNALGISNIKVRKISGTFEYTSILPIGSTDIPDNWIGHNEQDYNSTWVFHQVGWFYNVFDACIMLKNVTLNNIHYIPVNRVFEGENSYKKDLYYTGIFNPVDFTYTLVDL